MSLGSARSARWEVISREFPEGREQGDFRAAQKSPFQVVKLLRVRYKRGLAWQAYCTGTALLRIPSVLRTRLNFLKQKSESR